MTCSVTLAGTVESVTVRNETTVLKISFKQPDVKGSAQPNGHIWATTYGNYAQSAASLTPGTKLVVTGRVEMLKSSNAENPNMSAMMNVRQMIVTAKASNGHAAPVTEAPPVATPAETVPVPPVAAAPAKSADPLAAADDIPF